MRYTTKLNCKKTKAKQAMKTTLKIGLASLLVVAGVAASYGQATSSLPSVYGSGASQKLLWTFDAGSMGFSGDAYTTGGDSGPTAVWNSGVQSSLSSPSGVPGDITFTGPIGGPTNWIRGQQGYYSSASVISQSVYYSEFTFDYMLPSSEPTDSSGGLPSLVVWMQWGTTGNTDNNGNNVPYVVPLTGSLGTWQNVTISAGALDTIADGGNGTSFSNWNYLHVITIGLTDNNYAAGTMLSYDLDNVGFAGPIPEPATLALCGIGGLLSLFLVRRKR
ncbi:MAG: PEP-CTERM sorting domain-containing protein [Verrucomicrobiota bacterium]